MGLFSDTVPRDLYDKKCADYDALLEKYHALRQMGQAPVAPLRMSLPKQDSGTTALRNIETALHSPRVQAVAESLRRDNPSLTAEGALAEAARLDGFVRGKDVVPSAAESTSLPPAR